MMSGWQLYYYIVAVLSGGILSWLATHVYGNRSSRELRRVNEQLHRDNNDLKKLVRKLPDDLLKALDSDPRITLTFDEIHTLVQRLRPRHLSDEQKWQLIESLQKVEPVSILISAMSNDTEAQQYRNQIGQVFTAAGWPTSVRDAIAGADVSNVALYHYTGPISYPFASPPTPTTACQIESAFATVGVALPVKYLEDFPPADHRLHLAVGQKPTT